MTVVYSGKTYLDSTNFSNSWDSIEPIRVDTESNFVLNTTVFAASGIVSFGKSNASDDPSTITIGSQGGIYSVAWGIALAAGGENIVNNGVISGAYKCIGEYTFFAEAHGVFASLINNGTMVSGTDNNASVIYTYALAGESSYVVNTGKMISGLGEDGHAIDYIGNSVDRIQNTGLIIGHIHLGDGNDNYDGRAGTLVGIIYGEGGNDTIRTGADDDRINGGLGADTMYGGAGDDTYILTDDTSDTIKDSSGNDTITSSIGRDLNDYQGIENVTITSFGSGNLKGTGAGNKLIGSYGSNTLDGGGGNDILSGSKGADTLLGGSGKDVLTGGIGADVMTGGTGSDTFVFLFVGESKLTSTTVDRITDWSTEDSIDTKIAGSGRNYMEVALSSNIDTIEEATTTAKAAVHSNDTAYVFLYNSSKDVGFLVMDIDNNNVFETGVILSHSGKAGDFSYADLI